MTPWMQGHLQHATPKGLRLPINTISSKRERGDGFGAVTYASNPPEVQRIICVDEMGNVIPQSHGSEANISSACTLFLTFQGVGEDMSGTTMELIVTLKMSMAAAFLPHFLREVAGASLAINTLTSDEIQNPGGMGAKPTPSQTIEVKYYKYSNSLCSLTAYIKLFL
ncbi:hypothetical protein GLAREA_01130 [Glarea lozoyensis ATCC 20868]|uniref:Uncharacterized protein n=1 Tax=Glarea lozoyensis (strain ATCC 20868 / MF5171) TaxID=1116229 RepID=S3CWF1_GLAL2|nr:uncharacterized protein GLAREA_01130 [Glarea lozoyensis ATCC 20868]EPE29970.1 hypothetical protein GLAREA_01130 [Glarea lozoyensis ATCC 20868]